MYNYYYGNIHAHTEYSDGNQANNAAYPNAKACFQYAKSSQHIDFFGISEHNHSQAGMSRPNFHKGSLESDTVNQNGVFTAMYGMEYGVINNGGHVLIYGIDSLIGWEAGNYDIYNSEYDYNSLFNTIASHPGSFAYLAHMSSLDYDSILLQPYNAIWDSAIVGLAMRNGPANSTDTTYSNPSASTYNARFQDLLKKGYHVAPGIDHDNHFITFGRMSKERTVVLAQSLSRANIMDAYRRMRFYASDDWNAKVDFKINLQVMGSIFSGTANPSISVSVTDPDAEAISSIKIWYGVPGSGVTASSLMTTSNASTLSYTHSMASGTTYYYYAEITQADGDKMWTAPIWYTKSFSPLPVNLISFSGEPVDFAIDLNWITSSEINNDHFELFRSKDGVQYESIGTIKGNGNSTSLNEYSFRDLSPFSGVNYYRLDQVDFDGTTTSSHPISVLVNSSRLVISLKENPVSGSTIFLNVESAVQSNISIELMSVSGMKMNFAYYSVSRGFNLLAIENKDLAAGIYFMRIEDGEELHLLKVIIP